MTEIIEENNVIIFPPPAPNGTIIIQTTPMGQKRMMKMVNYDLQAKNYLDEVRANKTRTTFASFQAGLNRYGRYLAADGMKDSNCEYALSIPLMEHGHHLGSDWSGAGASEWNCLRLAAATWATTQDRTRTLEWLRRGAALSGSGRVDMVGCKEFVAVSNDAEFLAAPGGGELDKVV